MTGYVGPHPDGSCAGCGQRMIRITPEQTEHPRCQPSSDVAADDTTRALLTLAASGVAVEVEQGCDQDEAALWLGRLWGRREGTAVVVRDGLEVAYAWPADWARLLADCTGGQCYGPLYVREDLQDTGGARSGRLARWPR